MKRTFCTVIRDENAEAALGPMAEALAPARHWAFREIHINKRPLKDVKREALTKFGITARHFNGIRFELTQAVNAWAGGLKYRRDSLRERIKDLTKQISGIQKKLADPKKELSRRKRRQPGTPLPGRSQRQLLRLIREVATVLLVSGNRTGFFQDSGAYYGSRMVPNPERRLTMVKVIVDTECTTASNVDNPGDRPFKFDLYLTQ